MSQGSKSKDWFHMFVRERLEIAKGKESLKIHKYVKRLKKKTNRYRTDVSKMTHSKIT